MAEVAPEVPAFGFASPAERDSAVFCIGIFTFAGKHIADLNMDSNDTVLDLKREVRLVSGILLFKLVCGCTILEDEQTLDEAGLRENPRVQLVVLSGERFVAEGASSTAGLYLLPDGTAEAFLCTKRIINRDEDEEHTQRILWGHWTCMAESSVNVLVVFTEFERNVFNEAAMSGWTSRLGRAPLGEEGQLELRREPGGVRLEPMASLQAALAGRAHVWFPETLEQLSDGEACMFDAWHAAGTSTLP